MAASALLAREGRWAIGVQERKMQKGSLRIRGFEWFLGSKACGGGWGSKRRALRTIVAISVLSRNNVGCATPSLCNSTLWRRFPGLISCPDSGLDLTPGIRRQYSFPVFTPGIRARFHARNLGTEWRPKVGANRITSLHAASRIPISDNKKRD